MAYQFDKEKREESARVLEGLVSGASDNSCECVIRINPKDYIDVLTAFATAVRELRRPNPCDNCVGPGLAIAHGYFDMRTKPEEEE